MVTLMTMMAIWMFIEERMQLNFANLIQMVSLSFFITFLLSYVMIRQNCIRASAWQRSMGERIGELLAPALNKLFIDNKGDIDLTVPTAGSD